MANKGYSKPDLFGGGYTHYDEHGKKIGRSEPDFFGGYTNYDEQGNKTGTARENLFGGFTTYDTHGQKRGPWNPACSATISAATKKGAGPAPAT